LTHAKNLRHKEAATDGSNGKGLNPTPLHLEYESGQSKEAAWGLDYAPRQTYNA